MTEADTNRLSTSYDKETSFGVSPTGSAVYRLLRVVTHSLQQNTTTGKSSEVVTDRNITKVRRLGVDMTGDIVCELSVDQGFEDLIQSCLQDPDAWTPISAEDNVVSIAAPDQITRAAGDFTTATSVGDFILLSGWSTEANNRPCKVEAVATLAITTHNVDLVTEALGVGKKFTQGVSIGNTTVAAGTAIDSYSFEDEFADLSAEFAVYRGGTIDGFDIEVTAEGMVTITFKVMGADEEAPRPTTSKDSGTKIASGTALQFTAVDDVAAITESDADIDPVTFTISVVNGNHGRKVIGTRGPKSMGTGTFEPTGSLTALYEDSLEVDKHLAYEETSLALMLMNGVDDAYVAEMPSLQYSGGATPQAGQNQDVIQTLPWEAQKESAIPAGQTFAAAFRFWKFK